jgi:hypothetical protein
MKCGSGTKWLCVLALLFLPSCPVLASDAGDAFARVQATVDAFNQGKGISVATRFFQSSVTIVDDTPPFLFRGPTAARDWEKAYAESEGQDPAKASLNLLPPTTVDVQGKQAYVAVPANWNVNSGGENSVSHGVITVVLDKDGTDWRIASWIWTPR